MGNNISGATTRNVGALDSYVTELGADIIYEKGLGTARFLKTVKGRHKNGPVVIKIFIKPSPDLSLERYRKRLKSEREALANIPNVYNYQTFYETEKAGYIIRQYLASSLYDRISTRPFLSIIEKKWISFQILQGLHQARSQKVSHGDIKSENILVTSWNWVYITDFGSIKPVHLPLDDPTDFSFYFDTSGRRTCYIAPERFVEGPGLSKKRGDREGESRRDNQVTEAMDVFSAGCVIAELFLEGQETFNLASLFKYRAKETTVDSHLAAIEDENVRRMVASMIALDPSSRPSFEDVLVNAKGTTFPESFYSFLHYYIHTLNQTSVPLTSPASPFNKTSQTTTLVPNNAPSHAGSALPSQLSTVTSTSAATAISPLVSLNDPTKLPNDSDARIDRMWTDFEEVEQHLTEENIEATVTETKPIVTGAGVGRPFQDVVPVELHIPNRPSAIGGFLGGQKAAAEDGPALIMLSLISSNIRNALVPSSKMRALDMFLALACHLTDEAKLDRLVPYVVDLLHDESSTVRAAAIRTLVQVLMLVTVITPSNSLIFPEYIFPNMRHLTTDPDVFVRCVYAQCIVPLADTSGRYLEMGQALKAHGTFGLSNAYGASKPGEDDELGYNVSYDQALQDLHGVIQEQLVTLLFDSSSTVKRAILYNISELCVFFGRQKTNDVLLSHVITYLNDRDWMLRWAFFDSIVGIAACVGARSLEEYILPLMIQALSDVEEAVVAKVLASLTSLCELSLFQKMRLWELMSATIGFLYHPNAWIKQGAIAFIASAAKKLPTTDVWCIVYPSLKHQLRSDVREINERSLLTTVKPALPRDIFDAAVAWAMKSDKSTFWHGVSSSGSRMRTTSLKKESGKDALLAMRKSTNLSSSKSGIQRTEEDDAQLARLHEMGLAVEDEGKLIVMRDYLLKLANGTLSKREKSEAQLQTAKYFQGSSVELQKLGVVPQTVFVGGVKEVSGRGPTPSRGTIRPGTLDSASRRPSSTLPSSPRLSQPSNADGSVSTRDGTVVDDLRRRLAQMEGSSSSLGIPQRPLPRKESLTSIQSMINSPANTDISSLQTTSVPSPSSVRPSSPSESVMSGGIDILRRKHQKAAPAMVGSIHTNAIGTLEAPKARTGDDETIPSASGRTSPISMAGTVRGGIPSTKRRTSMQQFTTYEGQEPGINNVLEAVYQDNFRDPTSDFGPRVHSGPSKRRPIQQRTTYSPRDSNSSKRTEATLIAHLTAHSGPINGFAVAPDHSFFVSCSDDKTLKVWDTARLERSVTSKPRHVYTQHHARVTCVCILESTHCFASAADDGSLHVVRVHISQASSLPKYKQLQVVREHRVDHVAEYITTMLHYNTETTSNLVYATTLATVVIMDLRTMRILLSMEDSRHHGPITAMCIDRKHSWLLTGTMTGVLTLWDLRFGLRLKSWKANSAQFAPSPSHCARIHQCAIHPSKGKGRWVIIAVETQMAGEGLDSSEGVVLVEVWDVEKTQLVETFVTHETSPEPADTGLSSSQPSATSSPTPGSPKILNPSGPPSVIRGIEAEKSPAEAIAALVKFRMQEEESLRQNLSPHLAEEEVEAEDRRRAVQRKRQVGVRALLVGVDFGGSGNPIARFSRSEISQGGDSFYSGMGERMTGSGSGKNGYMLTGSEDRKLRLWDLVRLERSVVLSGLGLENERPTFKAIKSAGESSLTANTESFQSSNLSTNRPPLRTNLITHHQQQLLKPHQDCITALACIDAPFKGGIVSGDRSGVIKVFRVETD